MGQCLDNACQQPLAMISLGDDIPLGPAYSEERAERERMDWEGALEHYRDKRDISRRIAAIQLRRFQFAWNEYERAEIVFRRANPHIFK